MRSEWVFMVKKPKKSCAPAQNGRLSNSCIGMAGVFHVCEQLSLRGLIALPTARNSKGVDVLVYDPETHQTAALQVKRSQDCVNFWLTPRPENCLIGPNTAWVFLKKYRPKGKENSQDGKFEFDVFLEKSEKVVEYVSESMKRDERFPFYGLSDEEDKETRIRRLRKQWEKWKP